MGWGPQRRRGGRRGRERGAGPLRGAAAAAARAVRRARQLPRGLRLQRVRAAARRGRAPARHARLQQYISLGRSTGGCLRTVRILRLTLNESSFRAKTLLSLLLS